MISKSQTNKTLVGLVIILVLALGFGGYKYHQLQTSFNSLKSNYASTTSALKQDVAGLTEERVRLSVALQQAQDKNGSLINKVDSITSTVERLEQLAKTDKQLLQKYSKVFFLSENYTPSAITVVDTKFLFNKDKPVQVHDRVWPFLKKMLDDASAAGVDLRIVSGYRSFGTQADLKSKYKVVYGAGTANSFSADQGYSEHQLGTTLDFTTVKTGGGLNGFEKDPAYTWLQNNAYRYGFILSYPANNKYYVFEPWHWRFVGIELATKLHNENKAFYDLDQREIDNYLINFFNF